MKNSLAHKGKKNRKARKLSAILLSTILTCAYVNTAFGGPITAIEKPGDMGFFGGILSDGEVAETLVTAEQLETRMAGGEVVIGKRENGDYVYDGYTYVIDGDEYIVDAGDPGTYPDDMVADPIGYANHEPGSIGIDKRITNFDMNSGEAVVELSFAGIPYKKKTFVVLVFDNSSSMTSQRLNAARAGGRAFVNAFLDPNPEYLNHVAVVSFADSAGIIGTTGQQTYTPPGGVTETYPAVTDTGSWTNVPNTALARVMAGIASNGTTFGQAGLLAAADLLKFDSAITDVEDARHYRDNDNEVNKVIVFLGDGAQRTVYAPFTNADGTGAQLTLTNDLDAFIGAGYPNVMDYPYNTIDAGYPLLNNSAVGNNAAKLMYSMVKFANVIKNVFYLPVLDTGGFPTGISKNWLHIFSVGLDLTYNSVGDLEQRYGMPTLKAVSGTTPKDLVNDPANGYGFTDTSDTYYKKITSSDLQGAEEVYESIVKIITSLSDDARLTDIMGAGVNLKNASGIEICTTPITYDNENPYTGNPQISSGRSELDPANYTLTAENDNISIQFNEIFSDTLYTVKYIIKIDNGDTNDIIGKIDVNEEATLTYKQTSGNMETITQYFTVPTLYRNVLYVKKTLANNANLSDDEDLKSFDIHVTSLMYETENGEPAQYSTGEITNYNNIGTDPDHPNSNNFNILRTEDTAADGTIMYRYEFYDYGALSAYSDREITSPIYEVYADELLTDAQLFVGLSPAEISYQAYVFDDATEAVEQTNGNRVYINFTDEATTHMILVNNDYEPASIRIPIDKYIVAPDKRMPPLAAENYEFTAWKNFDGTADADQFMLYENPGYEPGTLPAQLSASITGSDWGRHSLTSGSGLLINAFSLYQNFKQENPDDPFNRPTISLDDLLTVYIRETPGTAVDSRIYSTNVAEVSLLNDISGDARHHELKVTANLIVVNDGVNNSLQPGAYTDTNLSGYLDENQSFFRYEGQYEDSDIYSFEIPSFVNQVFDDNYVETTRPALQIVKKAVDSNGEPYEETFEFNASLPFEVLDEDGNSVYLYDTGEAITLTTDSTGNAVSDIFWLPFTDVVSGSSLSVTVTESTDTPVPVSGSWDFADPQTLTFRIDPETLTLSPDGLAILEFENVYTPEITVTPTPAITEEPTATVTASPTKKPTATATPRPDPYNPPSYNVPTIAPPEPAASLTPSPTSVPSLTPEPSIIITPPKIPQSVPSVTPTSDPSPTISPPAKDNPATGSNTSVGLNAMVIMLLVIASVTLISVEVFYSKLKGCPDFNISRS